MQENLANAAKHYVHGKTYSVKDALRALGCKWDSAQKAWWTDSTEIASKARALVAGQPPLNNPIAVPQDHGPLDGPAEAVKHGRTAIGTEIRPFRMSSYKSAKSQVGETFTCLSKGVVQCYLVIAESRPYFLSAETLEDNDDFNSRPGWYRGVEVIAVELNAEEKAKQQAETDQKTLARLQAAAIPENYAQMYGSADGCVRTGDASARLLPAGVVQLANACKGQCDYGTLYAAGEDLHYWHGGFYDDYRAVHVLIPKGVAAYRALLDQVKLTPGTVVRLGDIRLDVGKA